MEKHYKFVQSLYLANKTLIWKIIVKQGVWCLPHATRNCVACKIIIFLDKRIQQMRHC